MRNESLEAVTAELVAVGAEYQVSNCGKHLHVKFKVGGLEKTAVVARTASDWRAALNARSHLRRLFKQHGITPPETERPRKPREAPQRPIVVAPVQPDYSMLLARLERLESELEAAIQLIQSPQEAPVRKPRFVRPSLVRKGLL